MKIPVCSAQILHDIDDLREFAVVGLHRLLVNGDNGGTDICRTRDSREGVFKDEYVLICPDPVEGIPEHHDFVLISIVVVDYVVHIEPSVQMECFHEEFNVLNDRGGGNRAGNVVRFEIVEKVVRAGDEFRAARNVPDGP